MSNAEIESPQAVIERQMQEVVNLGNFDAVYLFSVEGLPLAQVESQSTVTHDTLVEISVIFQEVRKMADDLGAIPELKEILLEGTNGRKIVFRFFEAFEQPVVLAVVVPARKTYRMHCNRTTRLIQKVAV